MTEMLFDDYSRSDDSPARHGEPTFEFLNRVRGVFWQEVRNMLTDWFRRFPASERGSLKTRLRSSDDRGAWAAFWELYLHEVFHRLGFDIQVHPPIPGTRRTPDFLMERSGHRFYLEAVVVNESQENLQRDRRLSSIFDAINNMPSPNFFVDMEAYGIGTSTPPLRRLLRDIGSWLANLNPDEVDDPFDPSLALRWKHEGWDFEFHPIPKGETRGQPGVRTMGGYPGSGGLVDDPWVIRDSLVKKAGWYGRQLPYAYVIAVFSDRFTTGLEEILRALFGVAWEHPEMIRSGKISSRWTPEMTGLWITRSGSQFRDVSAILTTFELSPWSVTRNLPWIIQNPWADKPISAELPFNKITADESTGMLESTPGTVRPSVIFDLPEVWPPGKPFPRGD